MLPPTPGEYSLMPKISMAMPTRDRRAINHTDTWLSIARRRPDFTVAEMKVGKALYFMQDDSGSSGGVVYQLRVLEFHPTRLVVEFENVSPIRRFLITLFHPGDLQFVYFLEARSPGLWGLYSLLRTGRNASSLSSGHQAAYVNRVIAFFRHFAAIPTNPNPVVGAAPRD